MFVMALDVKDAIKGWVSSPPQIYIKLKETLEDPMSSFQEFSAIIGNDPALTARMLKIVNSPFYGMENEVDTISHALGIIGTQQLSELVLATSVTEQFSGIPENVMSMEQFWKHSIACGITAKVLAKWHGESNLEAYYLAGMLHDIGGLVMYKKFPEQSEKILKHCKKTGEYLFDVELKTYGATHAKVGKELLKGWGLPASLYEPVFFHHRAMKSKNHPLVSKIINVADSMVDEMGLGSSGEAVTNPVDPKIMKELGFSELPIEKFEEEINEQYEAAVSAFL